MFSSRGRLAGAALMLVLTQVMAPVSATAQPTPVISATQLGQRGVLADAAEPPVIAARAWLIADAETGEILADKNAHLRLRPASTLKTLTAVTLLPRLDKQLEYKVEWEDAAVEGSAVGIVPGATYTVDQLFYGLMLPSGNDAAHALANAAGGVEQTVALMAAEAARLNALDTTVRNPSGLDAGHQFTSVYDLALFGQAGLKRPDFRRYVSTISTAFPAEMPKPGKERQTYQIYTQNPLMLNGYRGAIGVKVGYTTLAGRTFVGAAERGGRTLIVTMMGVVESTDTAAERLLNWGFNQGSAAPPVGSLSAPVGSSHRVRAVATGVPLPVATSTQSAGSNERWLVVAIVAGIVLFTGLGLRRFVRRPRRPPLPPL